MFPVESSFHQIVVLRASRVTLPHANTKFCNISNSITEIKVILIEHFLSFLLTQDDFNHHILLKIFFVELLHFIFSSQSSQE